MNAFRARFSGHCDICDSEIDAGDFIVGHPEARFIHEDCAQDADRVPQTPRTGRPARDPVPDTLPRGKTAKDRCDMCFQVPASNGTCGCYV